jgi:hypothetical protein
MFGGCKKCSQGVSAKEKYFGFAKLRKIISTCTGMKFIKLHVPVVCKMDCVTTTVGLGHLYREYIFLNHSSGDAVSPV